MAGDAFAVGGDVEGGEEVNIVEDVEAELAEVSDHRGVGRGAVKVFGEGVQFSQAPEEVE